MYTSKSSAPLFSFHSQENNAQYHNFVVLGPVCPYSGQLQCPVKFRSIQPFFNRYFELNFVHECRNIADAMIAKNTSGCTRQSIPNSIAFVHVSVVIVSCTHQMCPCSIVSVKWYFMWWTTQILDVGCMRCSGTWYTGRVQTRYLQPHRCLRRQA